jgi:hypothetical protein
VRRLRDLARAVGTLMARIVTPAAMYLLFGVVFIPIAVVLRLLGKRPLRASDAGWVAREVVTDWASDFRRPF